MDISTYTLTCTVLGPFGNEKKEQESIKVDYFSPCLKETKIKNRLGRIDS